MPPKRKYKVWLKAWKGQRKLEIDMNEIRIQVSQHNHKNYSPHEWNRINVANRHELRCFLSSWAALRQLKLSHVAKSAYSQT